MAKKKNKNIEMTSPKGVAVFPWLNKPDTKFNPEGEYRVKLRLEGEEADTLIEQLEPLRQEAIEKAKKDEGKKKLKIADTPWKPAEDEDGNELEGVYEVPFKMKAKIKVQKTGKTFEMRPAIFDASAKPLAKGVVVWGGSVIKVAFEVVPYYTAIAGAGISLRLKAVQVLELATSEKGAASYGFGEEEGYTSSDTPDDLPFKTEEEEAAEEQDGEEDF